MTIAQVVGKLPYAALQHFGKMGSKLPTGASHKHRVAAGLLGVTHGP
jgi:hypothetical protein